MNSARAQETKKKSNKGKGKGSIKFKAARRAFKKMPEDTQMWDVVRKPRKNAVASTPTKKWAKDPTKSDVKYIDDGSPAAKKPFLGRIKAFFSRIGKRGADKTNAKKANRALVQDTEKMKTLINQKRNATTEADRQVFSERIQRLRNRMTREQELVARWQDSSSF